MRLDKILSRGLSTFVLAVVMASAAWAANRGPNWITAWGTSQQPNVTQQMISNATVRMIARVTIPGEAVRIRLDNTFGPAPVVIGHAFVGWRVQGALLAAGSNRPVTFGGSGSVIIPPGGSVVSDPVPLKVFALQDLAVSSVYPGRKRSAEHASGGLGDFLPEPGRQR